METSSLVLFLSLKPLCITDDFFFCLTLFISQVYLFDLTYKQRPYTFLLPKKCHTSGGKCDAVMEVSARQREIMYDATLSRAQPHLGRNEGKELWHGCCWAISAVQFIPWALKPLRIATKCVLREEMSCRGVCACVNLGIALSILLQIK